jgi:hypothetical protein
VNETDQFSQNGSKKFVNFAQQSRLHSLGIHSASKATRLISLDLLDSHFTFLIWGRFLGHLRSFRGDIWLPIRTRPEVGRRNLENCRHVTVLSSTSVIFYPQLAWEIYAPRLKTACSWSIPNAETTSARVQPDSMKRISTVHHVSIK